MNILIVTAMFPPIQTGTSFYSKNVAEALTARNHQVTVLTLGDMEHEKAGYSFDVKRMPALRFPLKNYFKHLRVSSFFPQNYSKVYRVARDTNADVILLVNHYLDIVFPAIYAAKRNSIPLVCSVGTQLQSSNPLRNKILNILDRLICGGLVFPFCDRIISWDTQILKYLRDIHGPKITEKCSIINYGVNGDINTFTEHNQTYQLHNQIIGVGAVSEQRNFLGIIKAFHLVSSDFPDLRLKIIGHVYYDAAVKMAAELGIENRVIFTGELTHAEVLKELANSDLYYSSLSGKYLGLGTATIESMLMGLPTMANVPLDLLGGSLLLEDMHHIAYVDATSPQQIAEKIRLLLADSKLREKIGQEGKNFILKHMRWEDVAEKMESLFASLKRNQ